MNEFMKNRRLIIPLLSMAQFTGCTDENGVFNVFDVREDADLGKQFNEQRLTAVSQYPLLSRC